MKRFRNSTTAACSGQWRSGWLRLTTPRSAGIHGACLSGGHQWPPGPVVLALPGTCLRDRERGRGATVSSRAVASGRRRCGARARAAGWCRAAVRDRGRSRLDARKQQSNYASLPKANDLPVGCAFRFQDTLDNSHPNFAGDVGIGINLKLFARIKSADVVLTIGARLGEMTTSGYTLFGGADPETDDDSCAWRSNELGRVYQADVMIAAGVAEFANAMAGTKLGAAKAASRKAALAEVQADLAAWRGLPPLYKSRATPAKLNLGSGADDEAPCARDKHRDQRRAGFATWAHRFWPYAGVEQCDKSQLAPPVAPWVTVYLRR